MTGGTFSEAITVGKSYTIDKIFKGKFYPEGDGDFFQHQKNKQNIVPEL